MPDPRALTRVLDELLWSLRRSGLVIATSQAIDAARAIAAVGLEDRSVFREALACVVVQRPRDRLRFDRAFDRFFATGEPRGDLWDRLAARGFSEADLGELRELLERFVETGGDGAQHLGVLLERGAELDRMLQLTGVVRALEAMQSSLQLGFFTHRVLQQIGVSKAHQALAALRAHLREALGQARGDALADALKAELERAGDDVREHVQRTHARREDETRSTRPSLDTTAFASLSDSQMIEVRRAVRAFAERLRGRERVRIKRQKHGRVDPHRTLRRALATGGVPFLPLRRGRPREKPRLMLLCDVSDSVRAAATFMLEFVYAAHELFERTRSFAFVSELGETTQLFQREPVSVALGKAYGGGIVSVADNSNYGRVLRTFEAEYLRDVDRRTTVVILGDGRTNYHEDSAEILGQIRARARAVIWLCPEARGGWALGDSAMARYEAMSTQVLEVGTVRELEQAARLLVALR